MTFVGEAQVTLSVELCGKLADTVGDKIEIPVPQAGCNVSTLFSLVAENHAMLAAEIGTGRVKACVNEVIVTSHVHVMPTDEVALFPPVSGG